MSNPFRNPYKRLGGKGQRTDQDSIEPKDLEKGDIPAMIIAAFLTFLPALVLVIGILMAAVWFFFMRGA